MVTGITGGGQQIYGWNRQVAGKNQEQNETAALENGRKQGTGRTVEEKKEFQEKLLKQIKGEKHAPYDYLATDGCINYNGATFICDTEKNRLCLGDVSNPNNCLIVSLENGGTLMVNHDQIGDLGRAITMFTPEDQKRIMYAVSMHKKAKELEQEIEDDKAGIGDSAEASVEERSGDVETDGAMDISHEKRETYK